MAKIGKITLKSGCQIVADSRLNSFENPALKYSGGLSDRRRDLIEFANNIYESFSEIRAIDAVIHCTDGKSYIECINSTAEKTSFASTLLLGHTVNVVRGD